MTLSAQGAPAAAPLGEAPPTAPPRGLDPRYLRTSAPEGATGTPPRHIKSDQPERESGRRKPVGSGDQPPTPCAVRQPGSCVPSSCRSPHAARSTPGLGIRAKRPAISGSGVISARGVAPPRQSRGWLEGKCGVAGLGYVFFVCSGGRRGGRAFAPVVRWRLLMPLWQGHPGLKVGSRLQARSSAGAAGHCPAWWAEPEPGRAGTSRCVLESGDTTGGSRGLPA